MAFSSKETRASITDALASLTPLERSVIVLAYDGGLSQSEIAVRLGWPIGTVKTRTRRALRQLRDQLERSQAGVRARAAGAIPVASDRERLAHPAVRSRDRDSDPARRTGEPIRPTRTGPLGVNLGQCHTPC
jgi:DNA-binding CsgD family transcriptional regulator